jgi:ferrous iron transport protein B
VATLFLGTLAPAYLAGFVSAMAVVGVASLGVLITFAVSWALSRTALRGEVSTFSLELPPYRPPRIWTTIYTSVIDRTVFVLWRAVMFALPAGGLIWLSANLQIDGVSLAEHLIRLAQPFGLLIGLNGVVVVAYLLAIPANEIVIPTVLMLTVLTANLSGTGGATGVIFQTTNEGTLTLLRAGGWTTLTAVNLMLFSLLHNPCSTTLMTIYRETGSRKWMAAAALLPLALGVAVTFIVAQFWRLLGGAG